MNFHLDYSDLKQILLEAIIIVCFGMSIGLAFNYQLVMNAFAGKVVTGPVSADSESTDLFPVPVSLAEMQAVMQQAVLVDARIEELYVDGHLPKALSLPLAEIENRFELFKTKFPPNRSIIIYCSGYGCSDSFDLGLLLIKDGYHDVMVYEGGFPEWRDAGLPVVKGAQ